MMISSGRVIALLAVLLMSSPAFGKHKGGFCTSTAKFQQKACSSEVRDDALIAYAICINISDSDERAECNSDAKEEYKEERRLCRDQYDTRKDLCRDIGEGRYEPDFDPALFDDDFSNPTNPNPYFPLGIGSLWEFEGEDETVTIGVVLREFSPIEPDGFERKYFASGVGKFLEVDAESGEITELVACNVDPKCDDL